MDNITVGGVTLHSPLLNAAGTMGFGSSYADYIDLHRLGGLVTRTMTVKPRRGAEAPRLWETPSGLLNCVGMQNPGYENELKALICIGFQIFPALSAGM